MPSSQQFPLVCHPDNHCPALAAIEARLFSPQGGGLGIVYALEGNLDQLAIPASLPAGPADGLWQHTCCEAFIAIAGSPAYREFNFSPSGRWAVYEFADYRQRNESFHPAAVPLVSLRQTPGGLELEAIVPPQLLPEASLLQLGLSAVVQLIRARA